MSAKDPQQRGGFPEQPLCGAGRDRFRWVKLRAYPVRYAPGRCVAGGILPGGCATGVIVPSSGVLRAVSERSADRPDRERARTRRAVAILRSGCIRTGAGLIPEIHVRRA